MSGPVRFAILGFGLHAAKRLVPAFAEAREAELVGLWRRNSVEAAKDGERFGIARVFGSREELCASPDVDAVFVTSPDAMHKEDVLLAVRKGKAVLCEKPMAMNTAEAEEMRAEADRAGVLLGVAQNMRWNRSLGWMREAVAEGRIGVPQVARVEFATLAERSSRRWIHDGVLACGGPIGDVGVHCLDALRWVLGQEVVTLQTMARPSRKNAAMEELATMQGETEGGCLVSVAVSSAAAYRTQVEVLGTDGVLVSENALTVDQPVTVELRRWGKAEQRVEIDNAGSFAAMLDAFALAVRSRGGFRSDAENGVENMRLLDAAYAGWRSGRTERVR